MSVKAVTHIRRLRVVGPKLGNDRHLWVADLAADIQHGLKPEHGFMRNASLRVLSENSATRDYKGWNQAPNEQDPGVLEFHDPRLLHVAARAHVRSWGEVRLAANMHTPAAAAVSVSAEPPPQADGFALFTAVPVLGDDGKWPDKLNGEIEVPPLALAEGEISVAIGKETGGKGLWSALSVDQKAHGNTRYIAMLGGDVFVEAVTDRFTQVKLKADGSPDWKIVKGKKQKQYVAAEETRMVLRLTARGIEFDALIRDPFAAVPDRIPAVMRIEPEGGGGMRLVLVRESGASEPKILRPALDRLFAGLRGSGSMLFADISPGEAPLMWPLRAKDGDKLPYVIGSIHSPQLLPGSLRASIVTEPLRGDATAATATLRAPRATIISKPGRKARQVRIEAGPASDGERTQAVLVSTGASRIDAFLGNAKDGPLDAALAGKRPAESIESELGDVPVTVDARGLRETLATRYAARGLRRAGSTDPLYAFIALERGVVQMPVPEPPEKQAEAIGQKSSAEGKGAFAGLVHAAVKAGDAFTTLTVGAAAFATATVRFGGGDGFEREGATVRLGGAAGTYVGALWTAERAPSAEEVIPTLDAGPISLAPLPVAFGGEAPDAAWAGTMAPMKKAPPDRIALEVQADGAPLDLVHWAPRPDMRTALVAAMNMTRTADNAAAPSQTRDLVPVCYRLDPGVAGKVTLQMAFPSLPTAEIATGSQEGKQAGPRCGWGLSEVPLAPLTLQGVEHAVDAQSGEPRSWLRFDLPVLDELFASAAVRPTGEEPDAGARPPAVTALDLDGLEAAWREKARRLALTRTQQNRVVSTAQNDKVTGLAEPYRWLAEFEIGETYGDLPLGAYRLGSDDWTGGEAALAGLSARFTADPQNAVLNSDNEGLLQVTGFALAPYPASIGKPGPVEPDKSDAFADTRGFVMAREPKTVRTQLTIRRTALADLTSGVVVHERRRDLVTTRTPIELRTGETEMHLALRDLPMVPLEGGRLFEAKGTPEAASGLGLSSFDRDKLPSSVYEWRLYDPDPKAGSPGYEVGIGPLSLRPLRLWKLALDKDGGATELVVLYSVGLARAPVERSGNSDGEPFLHDDAYGAGNTVAITYQRKSGRGLVPKEIANVRLKGGAWEISARQAAELAFAFDAQITLGSARRKPGHDGLERGEPARLAFTVKIDGQGVIKPNPKSGKLEINAFGSLLSIAEMEVTLDANGLRAQRTGRAPDKPGLALGRIVATLPAQGGATVNLSGSLRLDDHRKRDLTSLPVEIVLGGQIRWFGAKIVPQWQTARIDHGRGVMELEITDRPCLGCLLRGLDMGGTEADGFVAVAFEKLAEEDMLAVTSARVEIAARPGDGGPSARYLLSVSRDASGEAVADTRLTLSMPVGARASTIGWPVGAVADSGYLKQASFAGQSTGSKLKPVELKAGKLSLTHYVTPRILDADLDPTSIRYADGSWVLAEPWRIRAYATHSLSFDKTRLSWASLDDIVVADLRALARSLAENANRPPARTYAYSPRYRQPRQGGAYAKADDVPGAGIVRAGAFGAAVTRALTDAGPDRVWPGLAMFGGAAIEVPLDNMSGLAFAMPWITALEEPSNDPQVLWPLREIAQAPSSGVSKVQVAAFDLAAAIPFRLDPAGRTALAVGSATVREVEQALVASFGQAAGRTLVAADRAFASNLPGPPEEWSPVPGFAMPVFWRALMALARIWNEHVGSFASRQKKRGVALRAATVIGLPEGGSALRLTLETSDDERARIGEGERPVDLVVLGRHAVGVVPLPAGEGAAIRVDDDAMARRRLARHAVTVTAEPLAVHAAQVSNALDGSRESLQPAIARHHDRFWRVEMAFGLDRVPQARKLRERTDTVFASPALGWPNDGRLCEAAGQTLTIGAEIAIQDPEHAWAGRARSLGGKVQAFAAESTTELADRAVFLAIGRRVLFDRGPGGEAAKLVAPPDRGLTPVAPRVRAPIARALSEALGGEQEDLKANGGSATTARFGAILPGRYETVSTGARPGVLFMEHDGLILTGASPPFDPSHDRFGRPADRAPLVWRQGRAPRSTGLPKITDLSRSRRTFVGENLLVKEEKPHLAPFTLMRGPGTVLRYRPGTIGEDAGSAAASATIAILISVCAPRHGRVGPDFSGETRLVFTRPNHGEGERKLPPSPGLAGVLARLGVLRGGANGLRASLSVGGASMSFNKASYKKKAGEDEDQVTLTLTSSDAAGLAGLRVALQSADADTDARLVLQPARPVGGKATPAAGKGFDLATESDTGLQAGPPQVISIPLPLVPADGSWLPVETATVVFGDAAYDRELAGPARQAILREGSDTTWLLALDRRDYDLGETIHFAFGKVNPEFLKPVPDGGPFSVPDQNVAAELRIEVEPASRNGAVAPTRDLLIRGATSQTKIEQAAGYAVPIKALVELTGEPVRLRPGDRLRLSIVVAGKDETLSVKVGLVDNPVIAPPAAIYGLVTLDGEDENMIATPALYASAPLPTIVEFPDLIGDLVRGHMRRRGLFVWRFSPRSPPASGRPYAGLVKIDRTGGGQIPSAQADFIGFPSQAQETVRRRKRSKRKT